MGREANDFPRNVGADEGQAVDFLVVEKCPFGDGVFSCGVIEISEVDFAVSAGEGFGVND